MNLNEKLASVYFLLNLKIQLLGVLPERTGRFLGRQGREKEIKAFLPCPHLSHTERQDYCSASQNGKKSGTVILSYLHPLKPLTKWLLCITL